MDKAPIYDIIIRSNIKDNLLEDRMDLKSKIRVIEDYPVEGISFKDITTLLRDKEAFKETLDLMEKALAEANFDYIVGIESRGFLFGAPLADRMGKGFIPVRKPGKLP